MRVYEAVPAIAPWLGVFADQDKGIPVSDVEALRQALDREAPVDHESVRHPGAGHAFHCDARSSHYEPGGRRGWLGPHPLPGSPTPQGLNAPAPWSKPRCQRCGVKRAARG